MPENEDELNVQQEAPQETTQDIPQETAQEPAAEGAGGRDAVLGRLRERYPDESIGEGDDIYGVIGRYMDEDKGTIDKYEESAKRLMDVIDKDKLAGDLFVAMAHGENPVIHLMRRWGPDILEWIRTPEGMSALQKAADEFASKQEQKGKDEEQWTQNVNASLDRLNAFAQSHGLDDERKEEVFDKLWSLGQKFLDGNYDDADYELALKALGYDDDVAAAREEGEIEGRNTRISERLRRSEPERTMPTPMQGGGESPEEGDWDEEDEDEYRSRDPFALTERRRVRRQ